MAIVMTIALTAGLLAQAPAKPITVRPAISDARGFADWDMDGNGGWRVNGNVLVLEKAGEPGGPIRRPAALAILKSAPLTDLTYRLEVRSTAPADLAVRDVQVILGYQSPTQFYYVHLSAKTDAVHNGIFLVNNADRKRIDRPDSTARLTDQAWHRVRVERDVASGRIAVFFDDMKEPILSTTDTTLTWGRVGLGSFDETGEFRNVEVSGVPKN